MNREEVFAERVGPVRHFDAPLYFQTGAETFTSSQQRGLYRLRFDVAAGAVKWEFLASFHARFIRCSKRVYVLKMEAMTSANYIETMCQYNRWMNKRLFEVCAAIPDTIRKEDKGAFFHSIHGTLNHLLLADKIWLGRFRAQPFVVKSLAQELHSNFDELRREREKTDDLIGEWASSLTDEKLATSLCFQSATFSREFTLTLWLCTIHFFNHQTHHRGQLTTLLNQSGYDSGNMDLMWLPFRGSLSGL